MKPYRRENYSVLSENNKCVFPPQKEKEKERKKN